MEQNSTLNQQLSPEQAKLQSQLSEAITAERFFEQDTGRLWMQWATGEVNRIIKDITSDKYEKDHAGYVAALKDLQAHQRMIRRFQLAAHPHRRAIIEQKLAEDGPQ